MKRKKRVVIGMSGGVDSSLSACLLKEEGYEVIGLFMKNWEEVDDEGICHSDLDFRDVISVSSQLDIPYYQVNFSKIYWDKVFARCLEDFRLGYTPNPDILCNQEIKFKVFFEKAMELEADYVATGHYCQHLFKENEHCLGRGFDQEKDQSYFLYTMRHEVLKKVLFPIGHIKKKEVRLLAEQRGLVTAQKKDSTGICFIGKRDFSSFLSRYIPSEPGYFETLSGKKVGKHKGYAFYTIGQRRGLGIGGQKDSTGEAWYVIGKNIEKNIVYVAEGDDEKLYNRFLRAQNDLWINGLPQFPLSCTAKIRYRAPDVNCTLISKKEGILHVEFEEPQKAITPRQSIVFYRDEICLGGALIVN